MLAHKRKELIKEMVSKYRIVRVSDLSERFQTSDVTIRRDLKELEEAGLLKRTHGGAIKVTNTAFDPALVDLETTRVAEKLQIARRHLLPKQMSEHGIKKGALRVSDDVLRAVIRDYTRESGVRLLERRLASICRKTDMRLLNGATYYVCNY